MKAVIMCGFAKIKRRKIPSLLLGICITITAALMVNALVFVRESEAIFDRAYEEMEGPQMCCLWNKEVVSCSDVKEYMDGSSQELDYQITENTKTIDYIEKDGVKLSNGILSELPQVMPEKQASQKMLSPKMTEGSKGDMPGKNEIWITAKIANILNLKAGDEVSLRLADDSVKVKVTEIVTDPVFGGGSTNVYRMWCGLGRLSDFPFSDNQAASYLEIRFREYSPEAEQKFIRKTEAYFQMPLGDTVYTYSQIKGGYTSVYQMAGAVLCFVSVILAAAIVVLTLFLVKSDMDEDVRKIGIFKSLGMTAGQIAGAYLVSYGIIGTVSAALGSILGGFMSRAVISRILAELGIFKVPFSFMGRYLLLVWLTVALGVMQVCFCSIFKIWKLNASCAVRQGAWQTDKKRRKVRRSSCYNGRGTFEWYYALRGIQNKKVKYLYIAGVSMVSGCLLTVCLGCLNAVGNIDREPETWGFIRTDIYVTSVEGVPVSGVIKELEKDPRVDYTYGVNKIYPKYRPGREEGFQSIVTELYELPWNEKIEDKSLYGRRPWKEQEIGVGISLAEAYGLKIGESMELFVNGEKKEYQIVGMFETLSNSGKVIRMVTDNLDEFLKAEGSLGDYMLVLSDGSDKWQYAEELNEKYGDQFSFIASKSNGENITGVLAPAVGIVLTMLFGILILVTMNLTFLLVRREQGMIGLLKAVGMTPRQILKIYLWRNCLPAAAVNVLGILAGTFLVPGLLTPYAKGLGLTEFPFSSSLMEVFIGICLLPACILLGTCVAARAIERVSVKELVSE